MAKWYGDVLLINPGSPARPRGGSKPSFAVLTLHAGEKPQVEHIELPMEEPKIYSAFAK
jgi:predicted phosphodiesterase